MPDRLILHIGMHKTGTTAVQEALSGYDDGATRMARLRHSNHSIQMLTCFAADPARYHVWVRQGMAEEKVLALRDTMVRELLDELALPRQKLLISGEEMSLMHPSSVANMAAFLGPVAERTSILAWLRPAASYVGSAFQQMVKAGQSTLTLPRPRYRERFEKFATTFGKAAMTYRLYDPDQQSGGSTVAEFCKLAGIPAQKVPERQENVALPPDALRLIWMLNREGTPTTGTPARLAARSATIRHVARRFTGRFSLPAELATGGIDTADIHWAESATGFDLSGGANTGSARTAERLLQEWLSTVTAPMLAALDEDLDCFGIRLTEAPSTAARMRALYAHFHQQAETALAAQAATAAIFRARNRGTGRPAAAEGTREAE